MVVGPPVVGAGVQDRRQPVGEVGVGEADVEEPRPGDLDGRDLCRVDLDVLGDGVGDGAGAPPERPRQLERDVRGEVAVARVVRRLELDGDGGRVEVGREIRQSGEGGADGGGERVLHRVGRFVGPPS